MRQSSDKKACAANAAHALKGIKSLNFALPHHLEVHREEIVADVMESIEARAAWIVHEIVICLNLAVVALYEVVDAKRVLRRRKTKRLFGTSGVLNPSLLIALETEAG